MNAESFTLDPRLEEILHRVAAMDDSCLMRVPRPREVPKLFARGEEVGVARAGLSVAERELTRVHRAEVAWLLRRASWESLLHGERSRNLVFRMQPSRDADAIERSEFLERMQVVQATEGMASDLLRALTLVEHCLDKHVGSRPTAAALAALSFRFEPCDEARILASHWLSLAGQSGSALRLMRHVLEETRRALIACSAWTSVGQAYSFVRDHSRAWDAYARASESAPSVPIAWVFRFTSAFQSGMASDFSGCIDRLGALSADAREQADQHATAIRARRGCGEWVPTPRATELACTWKSRLSGVPGRIADAFM